MSSLRRMTPTDHLTYFLCTLIPLNRVRFKFKQYWYVQLSYSTASGVGMANLVGSTATGSNSSFHSLTYLSSFTETFAVLSYYPHRSPLEAEPVYASLNLGVQLRSSHPAPLRGRLRPLNPARPKPKLSPFNAVLIPVYHTTHIVVLWGPNLCEIDSRRFEINLVGNFGTDLRSRLQAIQHPEGPLPARLSPARLKLCGCLNAGMYCTHVGVLYIVNYDALSVVEVEQFSSDIGEHLSHSPYQIASRANPSHPASPTPIRSASLIDFEFPTSQRCMYPNVVSKSQLTNLSTASECAAPHRTSQGTQITFKHQVPNPSNVAVPDSEFNPASQHCIPRFNSRIEFEQYISAQIESTSTPIHEFEFEVSLTIDLLARASNSARRGIDELGDVRGYGDMGRVRRTRDGTGGCEGVEIDSARTGLRPRAAPLCSSRDRLVDGHARGMATRECAPATHSCCAASTCAGTRRRRSTRMRAGWEGRPHLARVADAMMMEAGAQGRGEGGAGDGEESAAAARRDTSCLIWQHGLASIRLVHA
ncbi:hypothetical protein B0H16DRAFT_1697299 [Mycena metata]|uniref:Uncharacterized protein n=1 Tax=Mycena metata TaxID=1033252 RepID=A0AAD7HV42_9AGAR|nr:hypothetical protein B0H16DRAFT_1697299 [Mycena metata]